MKWFVYCGVEYYPWHEIVEAETAEEAADKMGAGADDPIAVFPFDSLAYNRVASWHENWLEGS